MLFHIHGHGGVSLPSVFHYLSPLIARGNMGVDVFLFLSGYCLSLSFQKNSNLTHFYIKRMQRLFVPYLIISIPVFIWKNYIVNGCDTITSFLSFVKDVLGISYWIEGMQWTWFVHAIIICYILFPLFFKLVIRSVQSTALLLLFLYSTLIVLYFYAGSWYIGAGNAYLRIPVFVWGIVTARYYSSFSHKRVKSIVIVLAIIGLFLIAILSYMKLDFFIRLELAFFVPVILWFIVWFILNAKIRFTKVLRYEIIEKCGSYSLEIYLCHILFINILLQYDFLHKNSYWAYLLIPFVSYIISYFVNKISLIVLPSRIAR